MKLTRKLRNKIYKRALIQYELLYAEHQKQLEQGKIIKFGGLCLSLSQASSTLKLRHINSVEHISSYPELMFQKPKLAKIYWWNVYDKEPRIKALKKAIKLSTPFNLVGWITIFFYKVFNYILKKF